MLIEDGTGKGYIAKVKKDNFRQGSLRTTSIGLDMDRIFAIVGTIESDPANTAIHSFLFHKDMYTMDQAKKWLVDNKGEFYDEEVIKTDNTLNRVENNKREKI